MAYHKSMAATKKTLYEILGVQRDATSIDVGLAYEKRSAELQRAMPPEPGAEALLHEAFEVLSHPAHRAAYDASLITQSERAAALEQAAAPDLVLEAEEGEAPARKLPWVPILGAIAIVVIGAIFALSSKKAEAPKPDVAAEAPVPAPPPPPPRERSAAEILVEALPSVGRVLAYEMSGNARPLGVAFAVDATTMVTTCEGVSANATLVVRIGAESRSATLAITDEVLDLCKLSISGATLKPLRIATDDPKASDRIYVIGANTKGELALTEGKVVKVQSTPEGPLLEVSMPIAAAGGGGAVFDSFGRVVAVASHRLGKGAPSAIPASSLGTLRSRSRPG
jgi:hypothetical protein